MVTDALDNGESARIPHAKTLTRLAAEERGARSGPIAGDVADDDIVLGHEPALHQLGAGVHHNLATREALAAAVVGVALDLESNAAGEREAEGLARVTAHEHIDSAIREALAAVALRHLIGQHGADSAVKIVQRLLQRDLRARCERGGGLFDQLVVKDGVEPGRVFGKVCIGVNTQHVGAADHLGQRAEAHLRHVAADLFGEKEEEVHDMFGFASELGTQLGVLGGNAHGARVQVALPHHDTAKRDERRRGEAELLRAEEGRNGNVLARLELAIGLQDDA
eukprot:scaffold102444_cov32-Tisochrysis_lutea.AAC.3